MTNVKVALKERSYNIMIGRGLIDRCGPMIKKLGIGTTAFVVTNRAVGRLCGSRLRRSLAKSGIKAHFEYVPDSEKAKSSAVALSLISKISRISRGKTIFVIALGGGVIGDVAGFVAAIYKRGIPYVQIPTTLLAQVDSAIGGKVAIDLPVAKNLVGAFHQPRAVISDTSILKSLPRRHVRNGLAEIIKYGVIADAVLFRFLERNLDRALELENSAAEYIIKQCASIKARTIEMDELDRKDVRAILNFGHSVGHAIEAASGYSNRYNHGEAIAIGMVVAARIALKMRFIAPQAAVRIENLIRRAGLPTRVSGISFSDIAGAFMLDKKFKGPAIRLVLPVSIGKVKIAERVDIGLVKRSFNEVKK